MTPISRRTLLAAASATLATPALIAADAPTATPKEIVYGSNPHQRLDLYPRAGLKGAPVLMFVHGGGWSFGDKKAVNALPGFAERHGFLLASAGYRLAPEVNARGEAEDVAAAAAWLLDHAAEFGGDPHRVFLMGHSAGAHLVALIGVDAKYLGSHDHDPSQLAGIIPVDGAGYDAPLQMEEAAKRPRLSQMYQAGFGAEAAALSPTLLVKKGGHYPPFLLFHVERRPDSREQAHKLADALTGAGGQAAVVSAPGETHMTINHSMGVAGDPEGERVAKFVATGRL
jgi:acetyl esterase/lipase